MDLDASFRRPMKVPRSSLPSRGDRALLSACALLALSGCATSAQPPTANDSLPADLRASPNEVLKEVLTANGDQTYVCRRTPSAVAGGSQLLWAEQGSEATLVAADKQSAGTVVPGPHFIAYDGSYVIGTPLAEHQIGANTLTWVRYKAKFDAARRPGEGRFADVTSIQRIDTKGGLPPQPDCTVEGVRLLVPYAATYMIYREQSAAPLTTSSATSTATSTANPVD